MGIVKCVESLIIRTIYDRSSRINVDIWIVNRFVIIELTFANRFSAAFVQGSRNDGLHWSSFELYSSYLRRLDYFSQFIFEFYLYSMEMLSNKREIFIYTQTHVSWYHKFYNREISKFFNNQRILKIFLIFIYLFLFIIISLSLQFLFIPPVNGLNNLRGVYLIYPSNHCIQLKCNDVTALPYISRSLQDKLQIVKSLNRDC